VARQDAKSIFQPLSSIEHIICFKIDLNVLSLNMNQAESGSVPRERAQNIQLHHYVYLSSTQQMLRNMRTAISEAISYQRQRTKANPIIRDLPNLDWFIEHIEFLISNIFLSNNTGSLKQQVVDIPMGTNAANRVGLSLLAYVLVHVWMINVPSILSLYVIAFPLLFVWCRMVGPPFKWPLRTGMPLRCRLS